MLWRVRTTLPDRPGSLAALAQRCGERRVNILGLQIFPGVSGVTDELVLRAPDGWRHADVAALVETAGGTAVSVAACSERALVDGPTRYLQAVRRLLRAPEDVQEILAGLLDAEPEGAAAGPVRALQDILTVGVGDERVAVRRTPPFTAGEHARAAAFAEVATELFDGYEPTAASAAVPSPGVPSSDPVVVRLATVEDLPAITRMHQRCSAESLRRRYPARLPRLDERLARRLVLGGAGSVVAARGQDVVALATVSGLRDEVAELALLVEDGWQRRGIGTRLLATAARVAHAQGATEVVLRARSHAATLTALAFASGLRARVRMAGESVVVTIGVAGLRPLAPAGGRAAPAAPATPDPTPA